MASLMIGLMLSASAGYAFGNTGVETLFFTRYGVQYLPYMYMALGLLSFFITLGITALLGRVRHEKLYIVLPIAVTVVLVGGWALLFTKLEVIYPILWLGMAVIESLNSLVIWGYASAMCDTRQSKRLFPLFSTGKILGSVLGGFGTTLLVKWIGTQNLILIMVLAMLFIIAIGRSLIGSSTRLEARSRRARKSRPTAPRQN